MKHSLTSELDKFIAETGLSEHRAGIILAKNGRLVERLRENRRIWPETEKKVWASIAREREKRGLPAGVTP